MRCARSRSAVLVTAVCMSQCRGGWTWGHLQTNGQNPHQNLEPVQNTRQEEDKDGNKEKEEQHL